MSDIDPIGLHKAVLWEQAKGLLRALTAASGQHPSNTKRSPDWRKVESSVEQFITDFEDNGLHE